MEKWGIAIIALGFFLITFSATSKPTNLLMVISGLFYVGLGFAVVAYNKKKKGKQNEGQ